MFNPKELEYLCVDFHGQNKDFTVRESQIRLHNVFSGLCSDFFVPNEGTSHIYKIIAGAGKHSKGRAVLKFEIQKILEKKEYDFHSIIEEGVFLVRFKK